MRLIELLTEQPQEAFTILARTPVWVWGLFGGLVGIGILQMRTRSVMPARLCDEPHTQRVRLPGSAMPLLLIVTIFLVKYAVGVELALQPALREHAGFALGVAAASGALSGVLAKRSAGLWRFARQRTALAASAPASGDAP